MYAARIAFSAVEMVVERVAAAALLPRAQRSAAVLARVARHVEALVQSHDANRFFSATLGNYRLAATSASGGISFMKVFNTMYAVNSIHCERYTIEALLTHNTCETAGMVGLACSPQYTIQNGVSTDTAFL